MKALTLIRPWCWAIAHGGKDVENRGWSPPATVIGHRIAIHSGLKWSEDAAALIADVLSDAPCDRCKGSGYHHGFGEDGADPDWCLDCGGSGFDAGGAERVPCADAWPGGRIVATALVIGTVRADTPHATLSPWFGGPIGWLLRDVVALQEPVPCRGAQGLWTLPPDVEARVRAQLEHQEPAR